MNYKHLTDDELDNILILIKLMVDNKSDIEEGFKDLYRKSIKDKTRLNFVNFHFGVYKTMANADKMAEAFQTMGQTGMFAFANMLPKYRNFMEWLSTNTGRPLNVRIQ